MLSAGNRVHANGPDGLHTAPQGHHFGGRVSAEAANSPAGLPDSLVAQPIRNIGRILTLDILPEARRFGLATRLMQKCEERLRTGGCKQIFLETAVNNQPAIQLYEKLGYAILRTLPLYYPTHALDAYLMGKDL